MSDRYTAGATKVERWMCDICHRVYGAQEQALYCFRSHDPVRYSLGGNDE